MYAQSEATESDRTRQFRLGVVLFFSGIAFAALLIGIAKPLYAVFPLAAALIGLLKMLNGLPGRRSSPPPPPADGPRP
jgi:hypothetical protein